MDSSRKVPSLVIPYGPQESKKCGYCKGSSDGLNCSWGMGTKRLTVSDYQYLIDRGWRRSGTYCYKPLNSITCCPCYPIRCEALEFKLSKSDRRLLRSINAYLRTGEKPSDRRLHSTHDRTDTNPSFPTLPNKQNLSLGAGGDIPLNVVVDVPEASPINIQPQQPTDKSIRDQINTSESSPGVVVHPTGDTSDEVGRVSTKLMKSRARRWAARVERMEQRALREKRPYDELMQEYQTRRQKRLDKRVPPDLETILQNEPKCGEGKHYLEVRLVRSSPPSSEFETHLRASHRLYRKYQVAVHGDDEDEVNLEQFNRFLVRSPLVSDTEPKNAATPPSAAPQLGSYHHQYWLNGQKLVAVGVVDLLPYCLSSVYLFYDPEYDFLRLGTYSALREIHLVRQLARQFGPDSPNPDPQYAKFTAYYMGFFIRSCPKMAYKAHFKPALLACPESYEWVLLAECIRRLDEHGSKYARFSPPSSVDRFRVPPRLMNSLDEHIYCRITRDSSESQEHPFENLGPPIALARLRPYLNEQGVKIFLEWASLIGLSVLSKRFQIVFN